MGYLGIPLVILLIGGYIVFLSRKKKKNEEEEKNDLDTLNHIKIQIDSVVSESALDRLLAIVSEIDNNHTYDENYIVIVDVVKDKIEKRRAEINGENVVDVTIGNKED